MYNTNDHQGQYGNNCQFTRNHCSSFTVSEVKSLNNPRDYYLNHLKGTFGRMGATGWCEWRGLCPFHDDHTSGSVNINLKTGAFKCHACGMGCGDVLSFHQKRYGLNFLETLKVLGDGE